MNTDESDYDNTAGFKAYNIKIYKVLLKKPIKGVKMCLSAWDWQEEGKCVQKSTNLVFKRQFQNCT